MNYIVQLLVQPSFIMAFNCGSDLAGADKLFKEAQSKKGKTGSTTFVSPSQDVIAQVKNSDIKAVIFLRKVAPDA